MSIELASYLTDILVPIRILLILLSAFFLVISVLLSGSREEESAIKAFITFLIIGILGILLPSENTILLMAGANDKQVFERSVDE